MRALQLSSTTGDPPALPGRQLKFDRSGGVLFPVLSASGILPLLYVAVAFDFDRLRSGPFEGPATVKPPALPEDTYVRRA